MPFYCDGKENTFSVRSAFYKINLYTAFFSTFGRASKFKSFAYFPPLTSTHQILSCIC